MRSFAIQIYLFAIAHINLVLIAVDLPPFFRKTTLKNGVRAYNKGADYQPQLYHYLLYCTIML